MATDSAETLRKAARLRAEVERLELSAQRRGPARWVRRFFTAIGVGVIVTLVILGSWVVYEGTHRDREATHQERAYTDLHVLNESGYFAGSVTLANRFERDVTVFVTVDLYDGGQQVGEIRGDVTLKPFSTSVVPLSGYDAYVPFTDSRVHMSGFADDAVGSQSNSAP